ncbi:MAG: hypothetical protein ABIJ56_03865 [Pseudomonadota bacterium]
MIRIREKFSRKGAALAGASPWALPVIVLISAFSCKGSAVSRKCEEGRENARQAWSRYYNDVHQQTIPGLPEIKQKQGDLVTKQEQTRIVQNCVARLNHTGHDIPEQCLEEAGIGKPPSLEDSEDGLMQAERTLDTMKKASIHLAAIRKVIEAVPCGSDKTMKALRQLPGDESDPLFHDARAATERLSEVCRGYEATPSEACMAGSSTP